jgi:Ca2+/H+ antiporter, TMEM165/GDT1 family
MARAADQMIRIGETDDAAPGAGRRGAHASSCQRRPRTTFMDALWISAGVVALAEIGDKTQLLAIVLAARFRKPIPIILGIFTATLLNHAAASVVGYYLAALIEGVTFQLILGAAFIAVGAWAFIPDKETGGDIRSSGGVFLTTLVAFFLMEIGDKTQVATSLLAARFQDIALVTAGTTLGMMAANAPAVLLGDHVVRIVPPTTIRIVAALLLSATGAWIIAAAIRTQ